MEPSFWNIERDLDYYYRLWEYHSPESPQKGREEWDIRAGKWASAQKIDHRQHNSTSRAAETGKYLRSLGLLSSSDDVIDIGCGTGFFAAEFAKSAHSVTCADISPVMLDRVAERARENGSENIHCAVCDFTTADVSKLGWENRFDLVFTSITPAVRGIDGLEKMQIISRAYCFNSCFISRSDALLESIRREVYGEKAGPQWDGRWFYSLFNLLYLRGYFPIVRYYWEHRDVPMQAGHELAEDLCRMLWHEEEKAEAEHEAVYAYLMKHTDSEGVVIQSSDRGYAWTLWDTRKRDDPLASV